MRDIKEDRFGFRVLGPVWYLPYAQQAFPVPVSLPLNLLVRAAGDPAGVVAGDPAAVAAVVRGAVHAVDPDQPVAGVMPMPESLSDVLIAERFSAVLMGTLAALGLVLAALGLYGVMGCSVGRRTGEIGLRRALGARSRDVLRLVVGKGVWLVGLGLALGVAGAWALTRLIASGLYQVEAADPATFAGVALLLGAVALLACLIPARRATRIDPMAALRCE